MDLNAPTEILREIRRVRRTGGDVDPDGDFRAAILNGRSRRRSTDTIRTPDIGFDGIRDDERRACSVTDVYGGTCDEPLEVTP